MPSWRSASLASELDEHVDHPPLEFTQRYLGWIEATRIADFVHQVTGCLQHVLSESLQCQQLDFLQSRNDRLGAEWTGLPHIGQQGQGILINTLGKLGPSQPQSGLGRDPSGRIALQQFNQFGYGGC